MTKNIKITLYIPSNNYGKYLRESIESVLRQTMDQWELLLIDEGSIDNTKDIMELYRGNSQVKILTSSHAGLAAAANLALKHAKGEYIMRLDADDVLDENILLVLSNYLDRFPEVALVFPDYFLIDDLGGIIRYEGRQTIYDQNHLLDIPANGACTLVRKNVLKRIGGYREDLGAQDGFDLWTKVLRQDKCANINIPLFYYRRHGKNLTENNVLILNARRAIKKDVSVAKLKQYRPIIAVIPCRRNYDIFPDLWSKKINGKTLLGLSMEICLASSLFDKVIVTADTEKVRDVMAGYKDPRISFFPRSTANTIYSRSIVHTLDDVVRKLKISDKGITALMYLQTPFATTESLEESVYTLVMNGATCAFSVEEIQEDVYRRLSHGLAPINPPGRIRSDFDILYAQTRSATAVLNSNLRMGSLTGSKIAYFVVPREEAFFIRTKKDYDIAKILQKNA